MLLERKLKRRPHKNLNAYDYVRNDGALDELVGSDNFKHRQKIKENMTGLRICLDCGATQRYKLLDPLCILSTSEKEPWCLPWMWRL